MASWDPFQVDEAPSVASTAASNGVAVPGVKARASKSELDALVDEVYQQQLVMRPWQKAADPKPDLGWYEPSCSIDNWIHEDVKVELGQGIAYVTLACSSAGNVLRASTFLGLCDAIYALHHRKDLRCVVFSGEGKLFCSGADPKFDGNFASHKFGVRVERVLVGLKERAIKFGALEDENSNIGFLLQAKMWQALSTLPQFSIALVNGSAMGDGLGLIACVDMAVSVRHAFFSLPEVQQGRVPCLVTPYLVSKMGLGFSKYMAGSGMNISAEEMKGAGLVSEIVENLQEAHEKITEICEVLTACGPRSVEAAKQLVVGVGGQPITEGVMFFTAAMLAMVTVSEEARVGMICLQAKTPKPWEEKPIKTLH